MALAMRKQATRLEELEMQSVIWWMIIGLVAGGLARLIVPGRQAMGWVMTIVLGLVGSIVGGFVASLIFGYNPADPGFHAGGLILSTLGAILVLAIYLSMTRRRVPR
jgi:uncharacterized membrane protein YeaQ/YmgE (transglycosylase-associated protein family)